jgi:hypothetical protein
MAKPWIPGRCIFGKSLIIGGLLGHMNGCLAYQPFPTIAPKMNGW